MLGGVELTNTSGLSRPRPEALRYAGHAYPLVVAGWVVDDPHPAARIFHGVTGSTLDHDPGFLIMVSCSWGRCLAGCRVGTAGFHAPTGVGPCWVVRGVGRGVPLDTPNDAPDERPGQEVGEDQKLSSNLVTAGVKEASLVPLAGALANPTWEARRLLAMAAEWHSQRDDRTPGRERTSPRRSR